MPPIGKEEILAEERRLKLVSAEREYARQLSILEAWEASESQWSRTREQCDVIYEDMDRDIQLALDPSKRKQLSKKGGYGIVTQVEVSTVVLAQKSIKLHEGRWTDNQKEMIRAEARNARKLKGHDHIIKLVGSYWIDSKTAEPECNILMFPVAVCDLEQFLDDCEEIGMPSRKTILTFADISARLVALGFAVSDPAEKLRGDLHRRLREIMGCLTQALKWVHSQNIQHRDVKPGNILVHPGRVLLTDFGISRDRLGAAGTTTDLDVGGTMAYASPEVRNKERNNPKQSDIYSLGCVFLHILTVIYAPNMDTKQPPDRQDRTATPSSTQTFPPRPDNRDFARLLQFKQFLTTSARGQHDYLPRPLVDLLKDMLNDARQGRPDVGQVNEALVALGGASQIYHGPCCRTARTDGASNTLSQVEVALRETSIVTPDSTVNSTAFSFMDTASTDADERTALFEFPRERKWYRIVNQVGRTKRALQADSKDSITVAPISDNEQQYWQFIIADKNKKDGKPPDNGGACYWICNKTLKPLYPLSIRPDNFVQLYVADDTYGRASTVVWYFGGGWGIGGASAFLLRNEHLNFWWSVGYTASYKAEMKNAEGVDTFWYLEEVEVPFKIASLGGQVSTSRQGTSSPAKGGWKNMKLPSFQ